MSENEVPDDWPSWLDRHRYGIGLGVFLVFLALYAWLVFTSGQRELQATEQAAMAVIGIVVSAIFGIILGLPLARRRVKIASQLRRAYGICHALQNLQNDVRDANLRSRNYEGLDAESLGRVWDEIARALETAIRAQIYEAERIIEDWSEMDPAERRRIDKVESAKREEIEELQKRLETARSVERDLEGVTSFREAVDRLEERIREIQQSPPTRAGGYVPGSARALLEQGRYDAAVAAYDDIIRRYPAIHTNYIGRARARHLHGDKAGALRDLDIAAGMHPEDPAIAQLRSQIVGGEAPTAPLASTAKDEAMAGNECLSAGDAEAAFLHYERAKQLGWREHYSTFNMAMASCLGRDTNRALSDLATLAVPDGSAFEINLTALTAVCVLIAKQPHQDLLTSLQDQLLHLRSRFEYGLSPLRYLEAGLRKEEPEQFARAAVVFELLRSGGNLVAPAA